ncbi:hypothetical protein AB0K48_40905, partial [Nonomuraea sp. NPDC055795]
YLIDRVDGQIILLSQRVQNKLRHDQLDKAHNPGIKEGNPGRTFEVKTLNEPGVYAGRCAELCGVDHSRMLFSVKLVAQDDYDKYLAQAGSTQ